MKAIKLLLLVSCSMVLVIYPTSNAQAKEDPTFWNLQSILTKAEQHLASIQLLAETNPGVLAQLDVKSGETCAANALKISRHALLAYAGDEGWGKVFDMTKDMFGPLVKPFGLSMSLAGDVSSLIGILNAEDEDAFTEELAKFVVDKVVGKAIEKLPDAFEYGTEIKAMEPPFADYLTDEAKRQAKKLYEAYIFPDDKELFTYSYDPGKIQGWGRFINLLGNLAVGETQCPIKATGTLTTYETPNEDFPGLTITVTGNCNCKWPKNAFPKTQLKDFTVNIYISLRNNGNGYTVNPKEIEYEVEAECCGEDISFEEDPYVFLPQESILIGTQSSICYELNNNSANTLMYMVGANAQYALTPNLLLGLGAGFSNDASFSEAGYRQSTKIGFLNPSLTYIPSCVSNEGEEKNWRPALRTNLHAGIGSYTSDFGGGTNQDNILQFGGAIEPGIMVNPCEEFYLGIFYPLFSFTQTRFSNEFTTEPFIDNSIMFGINKPRVGAEVSWRF